MSQEQVLSRLEWSVRALAQSATVQRGLFPSFVCVPDELALEFDESRRLIEDASVELTKDQSAAIARLDSQIESMSGEHNAHFWTDEALESAPEWEVVRAAARHVVSIFEWPQQPPAPTSQTYVAEAQVPSASVASIQYRAGSEFAPYPVGQTVLSIRADGQAELEHRKQGRREAWEGRVRPEPLRRFAEALGRSGFPKAQSWPPPPPGETMRHLTVQGAKSGTVMVPWHAAMKTPGYDEAFRILDEIIGQLSGGTVRVAKDSPTDLVADAHKVQ